MIPMFRRTDCVGFLKGKALSRDEEDAIAGYTVLSELFAQAGLNESGDGQALKNEIRPEDLVARFADLDTDSIFTPFGDS